MSGCVYHVSAYAGLTTLKPSVSTHGKAYVYAVEDITTGLLFGAEQDDFDFIISTLEDGRTEVCECYEGAFEKRFGGKACSVYTLSDEGFLRGRTNWSAELVCENEVAVLSEERVDDLYSRLLEEVERGVLVLRRYSSDEEYRHRVAWHIVDRLIRFDIDIEHCLERGDRRFREHYAGIVRALAAARDGSLLDC